MENITGFYSDFDVTPVIMYAYERVSIDCVRQASRTPEAPKYTTFPEIIIDQSKKQAAIESINFAELKAKIAKMKAE